MVASEKGVVVGRLTFREDGDLIDCQRMGVGGKAIPPNVDKVHACCFAITMFLVKGHVLQCSGCNYKCNSMESTSHMFIL